MKKFTVFESAVIGFFLGVIVAAYLTFVTSTGGFLGVLLNYVSLRPLTVYFNLADSQLLIASFVFFILVYTVYGAIIGALIKSVEKTTKIIVPTILLLGAIIAEQAIGTTSHVAMAPQDNSSQTATALISLKKSARSTPPQPQQYFGEASSTEAVGDLNNDGTADIAFITHRDDKDRGILYYLIGSIATSTGHTGTNLVFLGEKITPRNISITNETITVDYTVGTATTTHFFYAQVINNNLEKITPASTTPTL